MINFLDDKHWNNIETGYYGHRSQDERKALGQYFTPYVVAKFMAELALEKEPNTILDPALGQGIFPSIMQSLKPHRNLSFDAFEIDPHVISYSKRYFLENLKIMNQDFLTAPFDKKYDCVIGNPPYTIYKSQPVSTTLLREYSELVGSRLSPMTNIYNIFVLKALGLLKKNGRAVLIVPSEFLGTDYGTSIKSFFLQNKTLSRILFFDHEDVIFNAGISSACILVFDNCLNEAVSFQMASIVNEENPEILLKSEKSIKYNELDPSAKWYNLLNKGQVKRAPNHKLGEFVRARRGLATGDNDFFLFNKTKAKKLGIDFKYLRPCISRAPQVDGYNLSVDDFKKLVESDEKIFVLDITEGDLENCKKLRAFVDSGIETGVNEKYLPSPSHAMVFDRAKARSTIICINFLKRPG